MPNPLLSLVATRATGKPVGVYSVCSAHPWVIEAAILQAREDGSILLLEATSNQVNHTGGYTGMRPAEFRDRVFEIADTVGFSRERTILGGDHLGPNPWTNLEPGEALQCAAETIRQYAAAGYAKIHLDASMPCAGERGPLSDRLIAERAADLCATAEEAAGPEKPVYVIGTEVPPPGGAQQELDGIEPTSQSAARESIEVHRKAFLSRGLESAWSRVIALVVQPGLEFGDTAVVDYLPERSAHLTRLLDDEPTLVFEAHSTDYQRPEAFVHLVKNRFAILKVGPALTFAMREALGALEDIECQLIPASRRSRLFAAVEAAMLARPNDWERHYRGDPQRQKLLRRYSYSDRIRYYWHEPAVQEAAGKLIENMEAVEIPLAMLSRYLPDEYAAVRAGRLALRPKELVLHHIRSVLRQYASACREPLA